MPQHKRLLVKFFSYHHSVLIVFRQQNYLTGCILNINRCLTNVNLPGRPLHTFGRWDENAEKLYTFGRWDENAEKLRTFGRWDGHNVGRNAATAGSRGGSASAHLRKVRRKCGKTAHLRKVERAQCREKRSYSRLSWGFCFCTPSEGEAKTRKNCTPSEGGTGTM